jgi:hypothetical protein
MHVLVKQILGHKMHQQQGMMIHLAAMKLDHSVPQLSLKLEHHLM